MLHKLPKHTPPWAELIEVAEGWLRYPPSGRSGRALFGNVTAIHPQDQVGVSILVGNNPATPGYTNGTGDQATEVKARSDGRSTLGNVLNIMRGTATPHSCYGTSAANQGCLKQWINIPESQATPIAKDPGYKMPVVVPTYPSLLCTS